MTARAAVAADLDVVTTIITQAFGSDPVWSVALARPDADVGHHRAFWRLFVEGAARHGTVYVAAGGVAASVWLPPGASELDAIGTRRLDDLLRRELEPRDVEAMGELFERFAASRAGRPDHYYLSLLATHPDHAGQGHGLRLLAEDLARWDHTGVPSYLESTNPRNDHRYERFGYRSDGGFRAVRDDAWINAMWRDVGAARMGPATYG